MATSEWLWSARWLDGWTLEVLWSARPIGRIVWIRELRHPGLALTRVVEALNDPQGDLLGVWRWGDDTSAGSLLLHNGVVVGEWVWARGDVRHRRRWLNRFVDGLNLAQGRVPAIELAPVSIRGVS